MCDTGWKTRFVFTLLQILTVLAGLLWTAAIIGVLFFAGGWIFFDFVMDTPALLRAVAALIGASAAVGGVLAGLGGIRALVEFFRMCGRLKTHRAFTSQNAKSLHRISRLMGICAVCCVATPALMEFFTQWLRRRQGMVWLSSLWGVMLLAFLFAGVALAAEALRQLLLRAMVLQDENDWTI